MGLGYDAESPQNRARLKLIGEDLKDIIENMEIKGDQISILRSILSRAKASSRPVTASSGVKPRPTVFNPHPEPPKPRVNRSASAGANLATSFLKRNQVAATQAAMSAARPRAGSAHASIAAAAAAHDHQHQHQHHQQHHGNSNANSNSRLSSLTLLKSSMKVQQALKETSS